MGGDITHKQRVCVIVIALYALFLPSEGKDIAHHFQAGKIPQTGGFILLIDYIISGEYLLPCIKLSDPSPEFTDPITKYGAMRRRFLKEHRTITYSRLLLSERLFPHLRKVQAEAQNRLEKILNDLLVFNPAPDKAADGLAWAEHMETVHRIAEKMMLDEVVYA